MSTLGSDQGYYIPSMGGWITGDVLTKVNLDGGVDADPGLFEKKSTPTTSSTVKSTSSVGSGGLSTSLLDQLMAKKHTSGGSSGTSSVGTSSVGTSTIKVAKPTAPTLSTLPTLTLPTFSLPERDEDRQRFLSDRASRASAAKLSQALNKALVQSQGIDNPVARAEFTRRSMEGYGTGLADVLASGRVAGANEYGAERAEEVSTAQTNYNARVSEAQQNHASQVQQILANFNLDTQTYLANLSDYLSQPLGNREGEEVTGSTASTGGWSPRAIDFQTAVRKKYGL